MANHLLNSIDTQGFKPTDVELIKMVDVFIEKMPWDHYAKFFEKHPVLKVSSSDHMALLRLLILQEILCLDDYALTDWLKQQYKLLIYMNPGIRVKITSPSLLHKFRTKLMKLSLLDNFRKHCQALISQVHNSQLYHFESNNELVVKDEKNTLKEGLKTHVGQNRRFSIGLSNKPQHKCPNCMSTNIVELSNSLDKQNSDLVMAYGKCQFCSYMFKLG